MGSGFPIKFVRVTQNHKVGFELLWRILPLQLSLCPILQIFSITTFTTSVLIRLLRKKKSGESIFS